jgi:hypothetical protein
VTPALLLLLLLLQFGVYHLALHHATVDAVDAVEGRTVDDPALITYLIQVRRSSSSSSSTSSSTSTSTSSSKQGCV